MFAAHAVPSPVPTFETEMCSGSAGRLFQSELLRVFARPGKIMRYVAPASTSCAFTLNRNPPGFFISSDMYRYLWIQPGAWVQRGLGL